MNPFDDIITTSQLVELIQQSKPKRDDTPANLKYAIYVRKSTDDSDKQVRSLGDQLDECKKLAQSLGIVVLQDNIIEESETAKIAGVRPKFRKLLDRIIAGELDGIISWHPNRLTRNMLEAGEIIDLLDRNIIKDLKFPSHTFVNDASGKMLLGIVFVMAKQYSEQLSADIKRGNEKSVEAGNYINKPKHGYIKDANKRLQPDANNWAIIKEAFRMKLQGNTLEQIVSFVRNSGYFTRGKDNVRRDVKIHISMMANVFTDPVYAGVMQYGNDVIDLTELYDFMPMITVKDYLSINQYKSLKQAFKTRKHERGNDKRMADFLPRQVYCSDCDELMQAGLSQGKTKKYYYFRCETKDCERYNKGVRGKVILDFVNEFLSQKPFASEETYSSYRTEIIRIQNEGLSDINSHIASATKQASLSADDISKIKLNLSRETDPETKQVQKQELKRLEKALLETRTFIEELKVKKAKVSKAPLTFKEFASVMEALPAKIKKVQTTTEKHALIAPIFLNFIVSSKKVENYSLNSPFDRLISKDFPKCGHRPFLLEPVRNLGF
jgi:DNA invertase Pin-like site-specific DNA recombinase